MAKINLAAELKSELCDILVQVRFDGLSVEQVEQLGRLNESAWMFFRNFVNGGLSY